MNIPAMPIPSSDKKSDQPDNAGDDEKLQSKQAADLIRQKLDSLYNTEPAAKAEIQEIAQQGHPVSKHQQYMYELSNSGKSVAEIQTAWHNYYQSLPDKEKQEVWDEFYEQNNQPNHPVSYTQPSNQNPVSAVMAVNLHHEQPEHNHKSNYHRRNRSVADHKSQITHRVRSKQKLSTRHHIQSLIFGLGVGAFVVLLLLFGFFNERFIAPFITPSRHVSSTPIIIDPNSVAVSSNPEIIIPKINVEIPVVYNEPSIEDAAMESALERGVVHYATTPYPGQKGNVVIFGHSSNNIFNPGKYKFAFVLLSKLDNGDLFYLDKDGKRYVYRVYKKYIVQPTEVGVLGTADKPDTATLITCDPPGTSLHRLIVTGEQISPAITTNTASTAIKSTVQPASIPSNSTSLWQRFIDWL